jgi:hypothetical protein
MANKWQIQVYLVSLRVINLSASFTGFLIWTSHLPDKESVGPINRQIQHLIYSIGGRTWLNVRQNTLSCPVGPHVVAYAEPSGFILSCSSYSPSPVPASWTSHHPVLSPVRPWVSSLLEVLYGGTPLFTWLCCHFPCGITTQTQSMTSLHVSLEQSLFPLKY